MSHTDAMNGQPCDGFINATGWCVLCGYQQPEPELPAEVVERAKGPMPADPHIVWLKSQLPIADGTEMTLAEAVYALIARRRAELREGDDVG